MRRTRIVLVAAPALGAVLLVAAGSTGAGLSAGSSRSACTPVWTDVPSPRLENGALYDVAVLSTSDAWAVGGVTEPNDEDEWVAVAPPLIEHWDGTAWSVVPTPGANGELWDVSFTAPGDGWAAGRLGSTENARLLLRWDGTSWSRVTLPAAVRDIRSVSALAPDDVWGVGRTWKGYDPIGEISHWDGTAWKRVFTRKNTYLRDVEAISERNVWAMGYSGANALAMHWSGTAWKSFVLKPGKMADEAWLNTVAGLRGNDVWLAGGEHEADLSPPNVGPILLRWNGKRLAAQKHPYPGATELTAIAPVSATELWAVSTNYYWDDEDFVWHLVKGKWRTVNLTGGRYLSDIGTVAGAGDSDALLWAVGAIGQEDRPSTPLIRRYGC